eukprot:TRINITY_DN1466_c0_g1_i1.p1 TRINITY_DN1466_c0_g1~~TRINITY_DN1466_c0_g1_i1.p1  ORF type:complete len:853 (+),score=168.53 TRINITY_DN1466_c0_g1_i1:50-2560(+)
MARRGGSIFSVGAKVEYYSKSYDEWISCLVGLVRPDGNLQLKHEDGTVLKENADQSMVRLKEGAGGGVPAARSPSLPKNPNPYPAAASPSPKPAAKRAGAGVRAASPALKGAGLGMLGGGGPNRPPSPGGARGQSPARRLGDAAPVQPAPPSARKPWDDGRPPAKAGAPRGSVAAKDAGSSRMYPGDRAKIKETGREGLVLYVGTPSFSSKEIIGMQLDQKRSKAECDGCAPDGERLFRCPLGYGIFLPSDDVELLPADDADGFKAMPAPEVELDISAALSDLTGLASVKQQLTRVNQAVLVQKKREALGVYGGKPLHFLFKGTRGTGMSKTAQLMAHLLRDLEVISSGQLLETSREELLAGSSDVDKQMNKLWKCAGGGVLLVNDVQTMQDRERSRDNDGVEASEFIAKQIASMAAKCSGESAVACFPQTVCVVLASPLDAVLPDPLQKVVQRGLLLEVTFQDYSDEELVEILIQIVKKRKFSIARSLTPEALLVHVRNASKRATDPQEKNINLLNKLVDRAISRQTERAYSLETCSLGGLTTLIEEDFMDSSGGPGADDIKAALVKLDNVVGLPGVKTFIRSLHAQLKFESARRDAGIAMSGGAGNLHMIFSGNPGTGKTTVARIVASLLAAMGLLRKGHMVEADRAALVAGYSGQTALKTKQVVDSAMGGVLFVDEAYALVSEDGKDSFGKEALDTLIKLIEDRREDLVVILAGYPDEMARLVSTNPGVKSRFPTVILFEDYSEAELMDIACKMLAGDGFALSDSAKGVLAKVFKNVAAQGGREQGNGRAVRNVLEQGRRNMAVRLQGVGCTGKVPSQAELRTLEAADFAGLS